MDASPAPPLGGIPAPDPLRRLWGPVTVRVAWELLVQGVRPRGAVLREVREHALWMMPAQVSLPEAEGVASLAVADWIARCGGRYAAFAPDPDLAILPSPRWREAIAASVDRVEECVLRLHYADGLDLPEIERRTRVELPLLRAAREAVRDVAREVLAEDGVSTEGWEPARLDRLLARVATTSGDVCPGPVGLATESGRAHAEACPRCARALRLMREGLLSPSDLFPPEDAPLLAPEGVDLVALQLHPDFRRGRAALAERLGEGMRAINGDVWVVDPAQVPDLAAILVDAAERGAPAAAHLRLLRRRGPGRWARKAILGPAPLELLGILPHMEWGEARGMDPLPEPLPPPPSAARWWMGAVLVALLAAFAALLADHAARPGPEVPLTAAWEGAGVVYDTDDAAWVDVVAVRGGTVSVVARSQSVADKAAHATGDGRFRVDAEAEALVVLAGGESFHDLEAVLLGFSGGTATVDGVARRLRERYPRAAVAVVSPPRR